jgi:DNA-binding NtrC family response regulator
MRILVVDDQPEVLKSLGRVLSSAQGIDGEPYQVTLEQSHEKALDLVRRERFEVVVVDMVTQQRQDEGLDLLRALTAKSPITIVLTAYPSIPNCVAAMRAGVWDYLEKAPHDGSDPYDALLRSIEEGCRQRRDQPDLGRPDPNAQWVHENLESLMEAYPGQVVAILYGEVVEHGPTYGEVLDRLKGKFPLVRPYVFSIPDPTEEVIE